MEDDQLTSAKMVIYESLGASIAFISFFIAFSRGFDILNNLVIPYWNDNTKTKVGKRYPWILGGFVAYALDIVGFWLPPDGEGIEAWYGLYYIAIIVLYSIIDIPYAVILECYI